MANEVMVDMSGPVFDGRAFELASQAEMVARHAVAAGAAQLVRSAFNSMIRQGTGKFVASVVIIDRTQTFRRQSHKKTYTMRIEVPELADVVTTSMATYGPWLEGTGSRNSASQFKGYWGFRQAAGQINTTASAIAELAVEPFIAKMNL